MPQMLTCQLAALMIAGIYYVWRDVLCRRLQSTKTIRERVAYMLWVAANR
jgi:hypothetical protein